MSPLRTAVVGIKGVGGGHIRQLARNPRALLAAVADTDAGAAARLAREHRIPHYADYRQMLDHESLDAVVLATPHHLHAPMSLEALAAGLHVFVEKPIAVRVSEADRMVALAKQKNRVLAVGHNYRTFPANLKLREVVARIAPVHRVLWQWLENRPEAYYGRDVWRCTWRHAGGGVLMNQTSHDLDLLCWLLGPPAEVSAMIANRAHRHEVEDTAIASIRFAGGAHASVQFSTCGPTFNYRQFWGERGAALLQDERNANVHIPQLFRLGLYKEPLQHTITHHPKATGQPEFTWTEIECAEVASPTLLESFVDAALDGGRPITDGESALTTLELINAIILAGLRKKIVSFPVDREEYDEVLDQLIGGELEIPR